MSSSAKWTAVSFFAFAGMGAATMAFAGCTVTSGTIDNPEGGSGTNTDSGTGTGDGGTPTGDSSTANACPGNTKQKTTFVNAACQKSLESECCAELTACFNITPQADIDAGRGNDDCDKYSACVADCNFKPDGSKETDDKKIQDCQRIDCKNATSDAVVSAYGALEKCVTEKPASNAACQ